MAHETEVVIYFNPEDRRIVRTCPPGLKDYIKHIPGTSIVAIPEGLYDLSNNFKLLNVRMEITYE